MQSLIEAYKRTDYSALIENKTYILKIDEPNLDWIYFLKEKDQSFYFYITAWNPYSNLVSQDENRRANLELKSKLESLRLLVFDGVGKSWDSDWYEDSFCTIGGNKDLAIQLGKDYRQNAIVYGSLTENPTLLFL
jgi:hypothetical protein